MTAEDEIRAADREWLKAFAAGDLEGSLAFCADDCTVLPPNAQAVEGREAIRELFFSWFKPELKISWMPQQIAAASSGDLGFSHGSYEMSFRDSSGAMVRDRGKYVIVWKKTSAGWKAILDISNSDLPAAE